MNKYKVCSIHRCSCLCVCVCIYILSLTKTFKLLYLGNKIYYLHIIIYLHTVSGIVTFAAFTAVVTKIRVFVEKIKRPSINR
jgi:hypothetical protein